MPTQSVFGNWGNVSPMMPCLAGPKDVIFESGGRSAQSIVPVHPGSWSLTE